MTNKTCVMCGAPITEKNVIGINQKLLGRKIVNFYCMNCLADYLEVSVEDLMERIEEFKNEGCKLFEQTTDIICKAKSSVRDYVSN